MKKINLLALLLVVNHIFIVNDLKSQNNELLRVAFWNFENFFDPFMDSTRVYNDYTENGSQHWNVKRFFKKRNNMYKALLALSEGKTLAILGICEVENSYVTSMLLYDTPLKRHNYRVIHYEGADRRGIDVAMAYSVDKLQLINSEAIHVRDSDNKRIQTRDILYAKFYDRKNDTIHCFVNHWSSRYGGEKETIYLRKLTAKLLRNKIDSLIFNSHKMPKIIIMGDFNDTPFDESILNVLRAKPLNQMSVNDTLINLFSDAEKLGFAGTLKHKYNWQIFDQIIVSQSLLNPDESIYYIDNSATIFHNDFLFVEDEKYGGKKLFRTYVGPKYQGGFSDHLPIYIDLNVNN